MLRILDDTRIELDLETRALREAASRPLLGLWWRLWRCILEWIDCRFHCWRRLPFYMQYQLQTNWCWAANAVSVASFYDSASQRTQCGLVNAELPGAYGCCQDGSAEQCNKDWYLEDALRRTGNFTSWSFGSVSSAEIRSEILNGRVLGAQIGWFKGGTHFVMIAGYRCGAAEYVDIRDPWYGSSDLPLASFSTIYLQAGSWIYTYYTEP